MLWLRFTIAVKGGHSAYPHTGGSANKMAAALIQDLQAIEAMVPDEPAAVRATLDRPEVARAADLSLGAGAAAGDAPRLGQYRHHAGRREDQHAAGRLRARGRFPPARRHQPRRGAGQGCGDRRALSRRSASRNCCPAARKPTVSDPTHEMVGHLLRHAGVRPAAPPQPIVSLGGTDTRFWRVKGVPAFVYGCSPAGMGGVDESVSIAEFHHVMRVHALAAWDYLSRP